MRERTNGSRAGRTSHVSRRAVLLATGTFPIIISTTVSAEVPDHLRNIGESYFGALEQLSDTERGEAVVACADALCTDIEALDGPIEDAIGNVDDAERHLRRARFAVMILNEQQITTAIEPGMLDRISRDTRQFTRFVPLLGSLHNLQVIACEVDDPPDSEQTERFLRACLAFGLEVGLWYAAAPFRMAWGATRWVSNRSFLRYANHGCNGCIAFAMSELHWALRAVPYATVSERRIAFLMSEFDALRTDARHMGYDVDLNFKEAELRRLLEGEESMGVSPLPQEPQGLLERILADLPEPSDLIERVRESLPF